MSSPPATTPNDWKSNPVIVAILAGAAVFGFCEVYVVPIHTQSLRNEIALNADLVAKAQATKEKASSLERQLKDALGRVKALEKPNLFALGNPYPVGLGLVRVGQPIGDLETAYAGAKIEKKSRYWALRAFHSVFTDVTYYFDEASNDKKISHISFDMDYEHGRGNFLQNKLIEILGPSTGSPQPDWHEWRLRDAKVAVYVKPEIIDGYMVMREGYRPSWWPGNVPPTTGSTPSRK